MPDPDRTVDLLITGADIVPFQGARTIISDGAIAIKEAASSGSAHARKPSIIQQPRRSMQAAKSPCPA